MDVRSLLDGQKAAITKDDTNWQLSLSGLMKLGTDEDTGTGMDVQDGMGYKDYMRMLLFLEGKERMSMRAMGIIEHLRTAGVPDRLLCRKNGDPYSV